MKNQEKDLKNEDTGSTRRKLTKEELTALCRRMEKHVQKFGEYMRMVEEERKKQNKRKIKNKKNRLLWYAPQKLDTFGGAYFYGKERAKI